MHPSYRLGLTALTQLREDSIAALRIYFSLRNPSPPAHLQQLTAAELLELLEAAAEELDRHFMLALLAEAEALMRDDFDFRRRSKAPDPLSASFRQVAKRRRGKIRLDEDILENWKAHRNDLRPLVSEYRAALRLRHWLAHGRHFVPKLGRKFDFFQIAALVSQIENLTEV